MSGVAISVFVGLVIAASVVLVLRERGFFRDPDYVSLHSQGDRSLLEGGPTQSWEGTRTAVHTSEREFRDTVRIVESDQGLVLDPLDVECHGGVAEVSWYIGDLEPIKTHTGIHLALRHNGEIISTGLVGADGETWQDDTALVRAIIDCPLGTHRFDMFVKAVSGAWGIPYVHNPGDEWYGVVVRRGITVRETW